MLAFVMGLKDGLVLLEVTDMAITTLMPLSTVDAMVIRVRVNPMVETLILACLPCEYHLLQTAWGRRCMYRYWWRCGFPFVWGSVMFGAFHVDTKRPVFLWFTIVVGAMYLLIYLQVRCVSPWAARCVTTDIHALKSLDCKNHERVEELLGLDFYR
jgi:hypothetical protein